MPAQTMRDKLDYLVHKTGRKEAEIVAQAVEEGVSELYRKHITDAYIAGDLDRTKAVAELGEACIQDLDYACQAIDADVQWGLKSA